MDITIIGTGNMSRGIASRALAGGHSVTLLGHEAGKADALAGELSGGVRAGTVDAIFPLLCSGPRNVPEAASAGAATTAPRQTTASAIACLRVSDAQR